jgi:hypothetical protein
MGCGGFCAAEKSAGATANPTSRPVIAAAKEIRDKNLRPR